MRIPSRALLVVAILCVAPAAFAADVLFDASKRPMAGNADWVVDADFWDLVLPAYPCTGDTSESNPSRFPTPPQAGVVASTPGTYWTGAISSWAVELVKAGHHVESLPYGANLTFGEAANPQDLSNYELFIVVEPQSPFTADEKTAILAFVAAGGGLFMVADHETSDRDCDGWDSPRVWNDLTGATSASSTGSFGIWFRVDGLSNRGSADWFDDGVDANVETDPADPIIHGPFGSGANGLGLFGSTSMELNVTDNSTVEAHVWRTGAAHGAAGVTFATASYGSGRVAAIGDSSPADDGSGDPSDSLYPGWDLALGGVANRVIHLNACHWLLNAVPDTTPPTITEGPAANALDCSAIVTWTTDEPSTSLVDYGVTAGYGSQSIAPGYAREHWVSLTGLLPGVEVHYRASSADAAGNGPALSADGTFTTTAATAPVILSGPAIVSVTGTTAVVEWSTDEAADSVVEYGAATSYGNTASGSSGVTLHQVTLVSLDPLTSYHLRALSTDTCGNGPTASGDLAFATGPAALEIGGWSLHQMNSTQTYAIPQGTQIFEGGYLVVGRNAGRAAFAASHPSMPAATVYLDSNANGACSTAGCFPQINGGESFSLQDGNGATVDGATVAMSSTHMAYQRTSPAASAGSPSSWNVVAESSANPGSGAAGSGGSGLRIVEMSDAAEFNMEFVELYYDAGPAAPDSTAPAAVTDLVATPISATSVRLTWTAVGDDGQTGFAQSYDVRVSFARILSDADFVSAAPLAGEPAPGASGTGQQFVVSGLSADTAYYFALRVSDEVPNISALSAYAAAVTAPVGGGAVATHLVLSQLRVSGSNDDVIELYNPTLSAISLSGHSIQYLAANGNFGFRVNLPPADSVPPRGWYLMAANGYVAGSGPTRDGSLATNNLAATAGHALLVSKTLNVTGCSDPFIVDKVGYGLSATCPEGGAGQAAASPGSGLTISRRPGGESGAGQDTDGNAADFNPPVSSSFHNRASAPAVPAASLGNVKDTLYLSKDGSAARLDWANALGASAYHVYRGTSPGFLSGSPVPWSLPTTNAAADAELPESIFYYVVRASDGTAESED